MKLARLTKMRIQKMITTAPTKLDRPIQTSSRFALVLLMLAAHPVKASEIEPLDRILETARTFLTANLGSASDSETRIEVGQLDNRLRLAQCAQPPTAQFAPGSRASGSTTVNVRCAAPVTWSILVPVRIERYTRVVVVKRPLNRQQVIQPGDVALERQEISNLAGSYLTETSAVVGFASKRRLVPGQVMTSAHLTAQQLVKRGQEVTLYAVRPGLTVRMKGEAMEDGTEGQRIRVRNRSSKLVVEGYVEPSGAVRVAL